MNLNFTFDDSFTVTSRKHDRSITVDVTKLPHVSLVAIFDYGLQRIVNDAANAGGKDATADSWSGNAGKKIDSLLAGETRQAREGDPVKAEARNLAKTVIIRELKKVGKEWGDFDADHMAKLLNERAAKKMVEAAAIVAARKSAMTDDDASDILAALGE